MILKEMKKINILRRNLVELKKWSAIYGHHAPHLKQIYRMDSDVYNTLKPAEK
jgi:hypothetical protein